MVVPPIPLWLSSAGAQRCNQTSFVSTLENVAEEAKEREWKAPSIIIVGGVCSLHDKLAWFEKKPMLGQGVVVTRAREQASGLVNILSGHGACVHEFPTIAVEHLDNYVDVETAILQLARYQWGGFHLGQRRQILLGATPRSGPGTPAYSAAWRSRLSALQRLMPCANAVYEPDFVPEKYVAEHVVKGLLELNIHGADVLIPRAKVAREVLPEELKKAGCNVTVLPVYETKLVQASGDEIIASLDNGDIQYVTFTSSSTVENFFELVSPEVFKQYPDVKIASIGPITSETVKKFGFTPHIEPEEYTIPGLVEELVKDNQ